MANRPNKELALRYWNDPTLQAWWWDKFSRNWREEIFADFDSDYHWHVGHEAPTEPPVKMCELAGIKFPMPMTEKPRGGSEFWGATIYGVLSWVWTDNPSDRLFLAARICHATEAAAQAHHLALAAANLQAIEGAK